MPRGASREMNDGEALPRAEIKHARQQPRADPAAQQQLGQGRLALTGPPTNGNRAPGQAHDVTQESSVVVCAHHTPPGRARLSAPHSPGAAPAGRRALSRMG